MEKFQLNLKSIESNLSTMCETSKNIEFILQNLINQHFITEEERREIESQGRDFDKFSRLYNVTMNKLKQIKSCKPLITILNESGNEHIVKHLQISDIQQPLKTTFEEFSVKNEKSQPSEAADTNADNILNTILNSARMTEEQQPTERLQSERDVQFLELLLQREKNKPKIDVETVVSLQNRLIISLVELVRYPDALEIASDTLWDYETKLGYNHDSIISCKHNMASILRLQGNYEDAIQICMEIIRTESKLGSDHRIILKTKNNLALIWQSQEKYELAIKMYSQVLETQTKLLGPHHLETLITKNNLALTYYAVNGVGVDKAIRMYKEILEIAESRLGFEHPMVLTTKGNLATAYSIKGMYTESVEMQKDILKSQERILGFKHPHFLATKNNLAMALVDSGKASEGLEILQKLLAIQEELLGSDHPQVNSTRRNIILASAMEKYNQSQE